MQPSILVGARQLEQLLLSRLIPWAERGAPIIWLGTPPRSVLPLNIREEAKPPLPPLRACRNVQRARRWTDAQVNSVEVPIIGCVYDGSIDYVVRAAPGEPGRQWTIPISKGTFYVIPPGTPFSDGSAPPPETYVRAILIYLRHDGIQCHSFTRDKEKNWLHPYIFLPEPEVALIGERLWLEMQRQNGFPDAIVHHYLSIILHFMLRCIRRGVGSTLIGRSTESDAQEQVWISSSSTPSSMVQRAADYMDRNFSIAALSLTDVATHVGLSPGYLNSLFQREKEMTAMQYVAQRRLRHAQYLLRTSTFNINLIAHLCGFRNQSHFGNWFSKQTSVSPSQYRSHAANSENW